MAAGVLFVARGSIRIATISNREPGLARTVNARATKMKFLAAVMAIASFATAVRAQDTLAPKPEP